MDEVIFLQKQGAFSKAESLITAYMNNQESLDSTLVQQLLFELERGKRIANDYRLTEAGLIEALKNRLTDFDKKEFELWEKEGRFDLLWVNGVKRFANPSVSNLFFRYPELRNRKENSNTKSTMARLVHAQASRLKTLSKNNPDPIRLPRSCKVTQTVQVKDGRVPAGEPVSCWLPYPTVFQTQGSVKFVKTNYKPLWIDYPDSPIRSVYMEAEMPQSGLLEFALEYYYTTFAYYRKIDSEKVENFTGTEPQYLQFTKEEFPHEVFLDKMIKLSQRIVGDETNPYLKAKMIYNWIADSIKYSYAREYSTLHNISEYCYDNRYGDCGQESILFITLCRIAGVPARWQSGFFTFPEDEGMHDWTEIYVKPYGWLPVDTYMGIFFTSVVEDLSLSERQEMRDFYFGNIDNYRLVANKGHNQSLYPRKKHFRSETVDFQRGEVEWQKTNLYFTDWRWSINVTEVL